MTDLDPKVAADRELLRSAKERGAFATLGAFTRLSGPGWIASAITLGGGSLASSLYLGVLGGYSLMWLQPFAMILGVVMLAAIGYVTLSSGERPFRGINQHVSPVLGWGWALAVAAANVIWCMPQFSLAHGVLSQNLAPGLLGDEGTLAVWAAGAFDRAAASFEGNETTITWLSSSYTWLGNVCIWLGSNFHKLSLAIVILIICWIITWSYDRGGIGLRLYETVLKIMVAIIVLCFFGVVIRLSFSSQPLDWRQILQGFVPDFSQFYNPAATFMPFLDAIDLREANQFWTDKIVNQQRDVMISAAATAVGINMTFMFPYTMLRKGWTKEFRGLSVFDLCTGMFIPYVLATGCVVIASAAQFHTELPDGFTIDESAADIVVVEGSPKLGAYQALIAERQAMPRSEESDADGPLFGNDDNQVTLAEKRIAAMLVKRDAMDLAASLEPLTGRVIANYIFGLGVLAMVLSTISILMLISGFVFAEMMAYRPGGKVHRLGTLVAGLGGVLWPVFWTGQSKFYLAVVTSVFGFMLLPFAYVTFVLLLNSSSLLGDAMPRGFSRFVWNLLAGFAALVATVGAGYMIWVKVQYAGVFAVALFVSLAVMVALNQRNEKRRQTDDQSA